MNFTSDQATSARTVTVNGDITGSCANSSSRNIFIQSGANSTAAQFSTIGGETADASTFSGNIMLGSNDIANARGAQALTVTAATGGTVTFGGNLLQPVNVFGPASNAALTKTGLGTVILSGANNTYVGPTTVTAGTLQVDATLTSGGGTVTVNGGATLYLHTDRQHLIPRGTPDQIEQTIAMHARRYHALRGGGIFYVEIEGDAPYENIRTLIESIHRYADGPAICKREYSMLAWGNYHFSRG